METKLATFSSDTFGQLRTVEIDNSPWFVGKDVAKTLGYTNTKDALLKHVDKEDRKVLKPVDFPKRSQNATFEIPPRGLTVINESGLYSLILSSKLPDARQFKRWVTSEVLPSIRSRGFYATKESVERFLSDPDAMIAILSQISRERSARLEEHATLIATQDQLRATQAELSRRHYPLMVRKGSPEDDTTTIADLARGLSSSGYHISRNALFAQLRAAGFIQPDSCLPSTEAIKQGVLVIVEHVSRSGSYYTTGITTLGRLFFSEDFFQSLKEVLP